MSVGRSVCRSVGLSVGQSPSTTSKILNIPGRIFSNELEDNNIRWPEQKLVQNNKRGRGDGPEKKMLVYKREPSTI